MTISFGMGDAMNADDFLFGQIDDRLADIPLLHRSAEMKRAMRKGVDLVTQRYEELLPRSVKQQVPGIHVADMPDDKVAEYETAVAGVSGVERSRKKSRTAGGKRGLPSNIESLLESGHRIVTRGTAAQKKGAREGYASPSYWRTSDRSAGAEEIRKARRGAGQVVGQTKPGRYLEKAIAQATTAVKAEIIETLNRAIDRLTVSA